MTLYSAKLKAKDSIELIAQSLAVDQETKSAVKSKHDLQEFAKKIVMNFRGKDTQVYVICVANTL